MYHFIVKCLQMFTPPLIQSPGSTHACYINIVQSPGNLVYECGKQKVPVNISIYHNSWYNDCEPEYGPRIQGDY